jgi:NADPH-dependent 2,4-dienoyl-CoA reductase/sulfur reductase-like enzyme
MLLNFGDLTRTSVSNAPNCSLAVVSETIRSHRQIPGLMDGLRTEESGVCSNYSPLYVEKTYRELRRFRRGNAVFTFPNTPIKCAGAPQKIMYLAEHFLRKVGRARWR